MDSNDAFEFMKQITRPIIQPTVKDILLRMRPDYDGALRVLNNILEVTGVSKSPTEFDLPSAAALYQAVIKQIPMTVDVEEGLKFYCPHCGGDSDHIMYNRDLSHTYNYCTNCGQALDWEVKKE